MALTLETRQNNKNTAGASVSAVSGNNNGGLLGGSAYLNEKIWTNTLLKTRFFLTKTQKHITLI